VSADGAIAAAKYFVELYVYAHRSGDLAPWSEMSGPECDFCAHVVERVEEVYDAGGHIEHEDFAWEGAPKTTKSPARSMWEVRLSAVEGASVRYDGDGGVLKETAGGPVDMTIVVLSKIDSWEVVRVSARPT